MFTTERRVPSGSPYFRPENPIWLEDSSAELIEMNDSQFLRFCIQFYGFRLCVSNS